MGLSKGNTNNPDGRPKGKPNRTTSEMKQIYVDLLNENVSNIDTWIKEVAATDPARAVELVLKVSEFVLPKLKASEFTDALGFTSHLFIECKDPFKQIRENNGLDVSDD